MPRPTVLIVDLNAGAPNRGVPLITGLVHKAGGQVQRAEVRASGTWPTWAPDRPPAAILLTGGPGSPLDPAPWRTELLARLPGWLHAAPTLGICLGHQMLAQAYGWTVRALTRPRFGVFALQPTAQGRRDPLFGGMATPAAVFEQRHFGVFAPSRSTRGQFVLARDAAGEAIAVRFGPRAAGVVFHPEAEPAAVGEWFAPGGVGHTKALARHGPAEVARMTQRVPQVAGPWNTVIPGFLERSLRAPRPAPP